ncbi:MAG: L,D-transpeptidase [Clostridia bacterium]|nr:L,D-transpeptidase [Clostridia bacterium]
MNKRRIGALVLAFTICGSSVAFADTTEPGPTEPTPLEKVKLHKVSNEGSVQKIKWDAVEGAESYKVTVFKNSKEIGSFETNKNTFTYTKAEGYGQDYYYHVIAKNGEAESEDSVIGLPTKPKTPQIKKLMASKTKRARVEYLKAKGDGYEVASFTYKNFDKKKITKVSSMDKLYSYIRSIKNNQLTYIKVRSVNTCDGRTIKSAWSPAKTIKMNTTGWTTILGKRYYFVNGDPKLDFYAYTKFKGRKLGRTVYTKVRYYMDDTSGELVATSRAMWKKVKECETDKPYIITVSIKYKRVFIYAKKNNKWYVKYNWPCVTGANGKTLPGDFTVKEKKKKKFSGPTGKIKYYTCWYATPFHGSVMFHSQLYQYLSSTKYYNRDMGVDTSHGCLRMYKQNAKWIYDHVKPGTKVFVLEK